MLNNVKNECEVDGPIYDFGRFGLNEKEGKISGSIIILTDEKTQTTVEVHFFGQGKTYKSGKENATYAVLKQIMDEKKTVTTVGKAATKVRCTGNLSTNIYYTADRSGHGDLILREGFQVKGSFLHLDDRVEPKMAFNVDALVTSVLPIEGETNRCHVKAEIFDSYYKYFRKMTFEIEDPTGIDVLTRNVSSQPYYVTLSGTMINRTIQNVAPEVAFEFGSAAIVSAPKQVRDILILGASAPKEFPMDEDEKLQAKNNRTTALNEAKNRAENSKNGKTAAAAVVSSQVNTSSNQDFGF